MRENEIKMLFVNSTQFLWGRYDVFIVMFPITFFAHFTSLMLRTAPFSRVFLRTAPLLFAKKHLVNNYH